MKEGIEIASNVNSIYKVENFLNEVFKRNGFSRKIYCKMYLAVIEAVINGLSHGNQYDVKKKVVVKFDELADKYIFEVIDEGSGFSFSQIPDPRLKENLYKECGRGVFIMKQYSDDIQFLKGGSHVKLYFEKS